MKVTSCRFCGRPIKQVNFEDFTDRKFWTHLDGKIECETRAAPVGEQSA